MKKVTVPGFKKYKQGGRKITMVTAYDFAFAQIVDEAGIDAVLVGDSLAMVVQGLPNTLSVTMEEMLYHTRIVARGVKNALLIGDMPFMSYQPGVEVAIKNAGKFLQVGAEAVKLEGGRNISDRIAALVKLDIPVMGHIGLTPQSIHRMGGYRVQGRDKEAEKRLMDDAKAVQEAGAFSVVIEGVPLELAEKITKDLSIPTIGIGGGPHCDGQVLVLHDLIGLLDKPQPTFIRTFMNLRVQVIESIRQYRDEVQKGSFPSKGESYH